MASFNFSNRYRKFDGNGLDDHIFCDFGCFNRTGGDDTTGDGSVGNPYKTPAFAFAQAIAGDTVVFAPADMQNELGGVGAAIDLTIDITLAGDSKNRDVIFRDTVGDKDLFNLTNGAIENLTIIGYKTPLVFTTSQQSVNGCTFIDSVDGFVNLTGGNGAPIVSNVFINNDVKSHSESDFTGFSFFNSNIVNEMAQSFRKCQLRRCYFDENSIHIEGSGAGVNELIECHVFDLTTFDGGFPLRLILDPSTIDEQGSPALFVSPSFLDFAVQTGSPLLQTVDFNIGDVYRGMSFSPDQAGFVATVLANPDIEIVGSELRLVASVPTGESRTVEGFEITASGINRLSTAYQIGVSSKCDYVFEVRVADVAANIGAAIWQPWKPYRLGERMTQNLDGTSTGEAAYSWIDNNNVNYKFAQGRLVLTQL